jgi:competence protein ComEC
MKLNLDRLANIHIFWLALAFLFGIVLAAQMTLPVLAWAVLAGLGLLAGIIWRLFDKTGSFLLALIPFFLFFGAARYEFARFEITPETLAYYNEHPRTVWVTGSLDEPPDIREGYQNLRVKVHAVDFGEGDIPIQGFILIRARQAEGLQYGSLIRARGDIESPAEGEVFSYRDYLALRSVHSIMSADRVALLPQDGESHVFWSLMYRLKASLSNRIYLLFPDPEASLLHGIMLGDEKGMSPELQQAFRDTGTSHIIAISGMHVAILALLISAISNRIFGGKIGAVLTILGIIGYTLLVGATPSVVRAAIMGTLAILALQMGRQNLSLNALAIAALGMAAWDPFLLWHVGFQLSFVATLGLLLYLRPMQTWANAKLLRILPESLVERLVGPFVAYFLMTFAAQVMTIPLVAYHFGRIALAGLVVNPLILPALPPFMMLGGLSVAISHLYMPLGKVFAALAWPFAAYIIRMIEAFAGFKWTLIVLGEFSLLFLLAIYGILFVLTLSPDTLKTKFRQALSPALVLTLLAILLTLALRQTSSAPDGRLHLTFLDVGSGDAVLIQTPAGRNLLINGGPSHSRLSEQLGRRLPPFNRSLDYLVIAAPRENQVAALPTILDRFSPQAVLWSGDLQASYAAQQVNDWTLASGAESTRAEVGSELDLGEGAKLRVLDMSPRGMVLLIEWDIFRVVLPIGVNFETFERLENGRNIGPVTALLLSESGYAQANPPEWLFNLAPQMYILSVGGDDSFGMPPRETIDLLRDYTLLRTDQNGWIRLSTDGEQLWVEVERR